MMKFSLQPQQQAITFDKGYFYPGPAVKGVTLDMALTESQQAIKEYGRPEYDKLIADNPKAPPLDAKASSPPSTAGTAKSAGRRSRSREVAQSEGAQVKAHALEARWALRTARRSGGPAPSEGRQRWRP